MGKGLTSAEGTTAEAGVPAKGTIGPTQPVLGKAYKWDSSFHRKELSLPGQSYLVSQRSQACTDREEQAGLPSCLQSSSTPYRQSQSGTQLVKD